MKIQFVPSIFLCKSNVNLFLILVGLTWIMIRSKNS